MITKILKINPQKPEPAKIGLAARIIKKGGLVVFPTETVYGLGCNALDKKAVTKIFQVKKRDQGKPLPILIGQKKDLILLVKTIPPLAQKLMKRYWPGPLTLVFHKSKLISALVTGGEKKVAVRLPDSRLVRALVRRAGVPLIGTSANLSGQGSISSVEKVIKQFRNKVDLIIDSGELKKSKVSTVVDVTGKELLVLRRGKVVFGN